MIAKPRFGARLLRTRFVPFAAIAAFMALVGSAAPALAVDNVAESQMQQEPDPGNVQPALTCVMFTVGESVPDAPRTTTDLDASLQFGEAIVNNTLDCSGVEDTVVETVTWTGVPNGPVTYTYTEQSVATYGLDTEYQTDGGYGIRTVTICVNATAAGFQPSPQLCNQLTHL